MNPIEHIKALWTRLISLEGSHHAIAGGIAVGIFFGFTPLFGFKTLLSLGFAWVLGFNPIAAVVAVSLHDIVTPFWPVLLRIEYDIGYWLMSHPHHLPPKLEMHKLSFHEFLSWGKFTHVGLPLLLGSLFLAVPSALIAYGASRWLFHQRRVRPSRREL